MKDVNVGKECFFHLLQEAIRCDTREFNGKHFVKIFTQLMPQGEVCVAISWLSERARSIY